MKIQNNFKDIFLSYKKPYIWITGLGFVVYFRSLFFGFTYLDDNVLVLDNLFFLRDFGNIFKIFTIEVFHVLHASAAYYRPILTLSLMIDSWISGPSPFFYHLSNVAIHLTNSVLVYTLFIKMKYKKDIAFLLAIVFTVHPVLSQAVAWIPGRNDSLLLLFLIPTFIFFINFLETENNKYYKWHLIFFSLSMFTKESAIFIPILLGLYGLYINKEAIFKKNLLKFAIGWIPIYVIWYVLRKIALVNPIRYTSYDSINSTLQNLPAILLYIGKILMPVNLSVLPTLQDSTLIYGVISLILVIALLIFSQKIRYVYLLFGLAWLLIFLVPSFIRPSPDYVADFIEHRIYVPIIGFFILIAEISFIKNFNLNKYVYILPYVLITIFLALFTIFHIGVFSDRLNFWKNAVENSPSHPLAHKNLGAMYYLDGNLDDAESEFVASLELNPIEPMIHNNLGLIYLNRGNYDEAKEEFYKELETYPNYDNAYYNLGLLYYRKEDFENAKEMWLKTLEVNPDHVGALTNLAVYYSERKDKIKANYFYNEAVKRGAKF